MQLGVSSHFLTQSKILNHTLSGAYLSDCGTLSVNHHPPFLQQPGVVVAIVVVGVVVVNVVVVLVVVVVDVLVDCIHEY